METPIRRSILVGLLAAPMLFLGTAAQGADMTARTTSGNGNPNLVYACVRKGDGYVRIVSFRDRCHRWERAMTWVREVPTPPATPPAPAPSGNGVEVADSAGTVLGPVVGVNIGYPIVAFRTSSNAVFTLTVSRDAFLSPDTVYYTQPMCGGAPFLIPTPDSPVATAAPDAQGRVWVDDGSNQVGLVDLATYFDPSSGMCFSFGGQANAVQGTQVFEVGNFTRPFKVR